MDTIDELIEWSINTKDRFTLLREIAKGVLSRNTPVECFNLARNLFKQGDYHPRALSTYIFGHIAPFNSDYLKFMRTTISLDSDWQVQEILAQAFDCFCSKRGYEKALPIISDWLADSHPNVRRAVTEGLRIWTGRPYFNEHPDIAICMLSELKEDESNYVRKSVGNALKDISKKHPDLVKNELNRWNLLKSNVYETYTFAAKKLTPVRKKQVRGVRRKQSLNIQ